jgi:GAF domain-containing protein
VSEAISELSPQEQELLGEVGRRLEDHMPVLTAGWERALDDLLAAEGVKARKSLRQESVSAAYAMLQALAQGRPDAGWREGRAYGETMALKGVGHSFMGKWLTALRQSLVTVLSQVYADDPQLDAAVVAFSKFYAAYIFHVTESFSSRQQRLLMEQQEALRHAYEESQRRVVELEVLNEIGRAIASAMDLEGLLELVYQQTSRLMNTTNFYIALCDEPRQEWISALDQEHGERLPPARNNIQAGLTGYIIRTRKPVLLHTMQENLESKQRQGLTALGELASSWLGVPMIAQDRVVGVVGVQSYDEENAYDEGHLRILSTIASQAAVAVQNAHLYQEARRRLDELEVLNEVGRAITSTMDLDALVESIYRQTSRLMDTTNYFLVLYDKDQELLDFRLHIEEGVREERRTRALGTGLTGYIVRNKVPLHFPYGPDEFLKQQGIVRIGRPSKSWLGVPLIAQDRVVGVMAVQSYTQERAYDEGHLRVLSSIAAQSAVALENARLYQVARRQVEEMEALYRIGAASAGHLTLEEICQSVYEQASVVMDTTAFYVALYERERDEVVLALDYEEGKHQEPTRFKKAEHSGLTGWVLDHQEGLLVRDWEQAPIELRRIAVTVGEGDEPRSWLGVPMVVRGESIGMIAAQSWQAGVFDEHHKQVLEMIAHQAAAAIENARLYQEAQGRVVQLSALQQVGLKLAATTDLTETLDAIADSAMELFHPTDILIFLYDAGQDSFTLGTGLSETGERGLSTPTPRKEGLSSLTACSGKIMAVEDAPNHPLYARPDQRLQGLQAIVSVPLVRAGQVLGVLNVSYHDPHRFTAEELRLLQSLADQAAVAVGNARLFHQMQSVMQELQETAETQSELLRLLQDLSTPVVPLLKGVLLMPLVGSVDSARGAQILQRLLQMVEQQHAQVVLVDITGVPVVDTGVAQILLQSVQAVRFLGGEAVLVGIRPEVAQTLVGLGVNLAGIATRADLQSGVAYAMRRAGQEQARRPAPPSGPSLEKK